MGSQETGTVSPCDGSIDGIFLFPGVNFLLKGVGCVCHDLLPSFPVFFAQFFIGLSSALCDILGQ